MTQSDVMDFRWTSFLFFKKRQQKNPQDIQTCKTYKMFCTYSKLIKVRGFVNNEGKKINIDIDYSISN